ncbi:collagen alpha-1(I) chain-like [Mustela nigripes]|uniref:collagen alpha-1(I) chain-like n=1 Tax=Mustela nigripes TaxID=77151 RepID=UPI0028162C2E|nr:collagen alpha-1(I) chain-like [Mustela nigripes]
MRVPPPGEGAQSPPLRLNPGHPRICAGSAVFLPGLGLCPPPRQHPFPGAPAGDAAHGPLGPHWPPGLITTVRAGGDAAGGAGGRGRAGPAGRAPRLFSSVPRPRAPRGRGGRRDPQPKKPRGRSGAAAVREGGQVGLRRARLRVLPLGGGGGRSPPELGSTPGPRSRRRPQEVTLSPPLLDAARPGRTGTGQLSRAMLEGDIDLEGLSPKEAPAARTSVGLQPRS